MDIVELIDGLQSGEILPSDIGWQVTDPDGNIVESGPVAFAEMTSELLEQIDQEG